MLTGRFWRNWIDPPVHRPANKNDRKVTVKKHEQHHNHHDHDHHVHHHQHDYDHHVHHHQHDHHQHDHHQHDHVRRPQRHSRTQSSGNGLMDLGAAIKALGGGRNPVSVSFEEGPSRGYSGPGQSLSMIDTGRSWVIRASAPGARKSDFQVSHSWMNRTVTARGRSRYMKNGVERSAGFERTFKMEREADMGRVKQRWDGKTMTVEVPKRH